MRQPLTDLLSPEQFETLREAIERSSGIVLGAEKLSHLDSVVRERMALCDESDLGGYLARVIADASSDDEKEALIASLIVGETSFFRTPALYDVLQKKLLPEMASGGASFPIRIWSAGCATGEEPYSVAIAALHAFGGRSAEPVRILATDLHSGFLDIARAGIYPAAALRDASPLLVMKYFRPLPDGRLRVSDEVRRLVSFEQRNLSEVFRQDPGRERFSAILCRNVMIYFRPETTRRVVASFHDRLADDGVLFLGHSETLWGISESFRLEERDGLFYHRKRDAGEKAIPAIPPKQSVRPTPRPRAVSGAGASTPSREPVATVSPSPVSARREPGPDLPQPAHPPHGPAADAVALAMAQRAEGLIDSDRGEEAETICREAIAIFPGCVEAEYLLAVLYRRSGRSGEALIHAARALLVDPLFVQAAVEIAECLTIQGKRADSDGHWRALLKMLDGPVHFPRLSPATGMTISALREYAASRAK